VIARGLSPFRAGSQAAYILAAAGIKRAKDSSFTELPRASILANIRA
jgi:hypothetical protein